MKKENLFDVLLCTGTLNSGAKVCSTLIPEMEIYGYIPMGEDDRSPYNSSPLLGLDFKMSNTLVVSNRLMVTYSDYNGLMDSKIVNKRAVHPILKSVELQENGKNYELPLNKLYIPKYVFNDAYREFRRSVIYRGYGNKLRQLNGIIVKQNEETHATEYYYKPEESEFLFHDTFGNEIKAVGSNFCVVCRYTNQVTGNLAYALFQPEDLVIIA